MPNADHCQLNDAGTHLRPEATTIQGRDDAQKHQVNQDRALSAAAMDAYAPHIAGHDEKTLKDHSQAAHSKLIEANILPRLDLQQSMANNITDKIPPALSNQAKLESSLKVATAAGVDQRMYNDCFFMSALASLANTPGGGKKVADIVKADADGSYQVTFPGDKKHPINVTNKDLAYYKPQSSSIWGEVIETAFLKYEHATKENNWAINNSIQDNAPQRALTLLTGQQAMSNPLKANDYIGGIDRDDLTNRLLNALKTGEPITVTSDLTAQPAPGDTYPMVRGHQYSVVAFDPRSDIVTVRNPWGLQGHTKLRKNGTEIDGIKNIGNGKLTMSLDTFQQSFDSIDIVGQTRDDGVFARFRHGVAHYDKVVTNDVGGLERQAQSDSIKTGLDVAIDAAAMSQDPHHLLTHVQKLSGDLETDSTAEAVHVLQHAGKIIGDDWRNAGDMLQPLKRANW